MISKVHNSKFNAKNAGLYQGKDIMTEKEIKVLMEEIIRETNISEICSKEGIDAKLYYQWSKGFLDVIRNKLGSNHTSETIENEIHQLKNENLILSRLVAELSTEVQLLKKRLNDSIGS